jgi:molecular chaperone GrpE (heat shock protein)
MSIADSIAATIASVPKSRSLLAAEGALAAARAEREAIMPQLHALYNDRSADTSKTERKIAALSKVRQEIEMRCKTLKQRRTEELEPWKKAVAKAITLKLKDLAVNLMAAIDNVEAATTALVELQQSFPGALSTSVPLSPPILHDWKRACRRILNPEEIC